ncbi:ANGPTL6 [Bugula neritina]|uniref:ANGPTL6 n=1 Tax=Bugula neritina TaxID=10212 RepID=A0A7J7J6R9_BUGNE|nr:ANGPTL6 [Bugula neritina]
MTASQTMNQRLLMLIIVLCSVYCCDCFKRIKYPKDCHDIRLGGHIKSGVYKIYLNSSYSVKVLCDHQVNKSYTIVQQRMYGNENFQRTYNDYQIGFGSVSGDFWIGLIMMQHLTSQGNTVMDLQLQDWNGNNRAGTYQHFSLGSAQDRYRLQVSGYAGTVPDDFSYSSGRQFATYDYPDTYNCAGNQKAGWWYNYCSYALLNGIYYTGGPYVPTGGYYDGIYWKDWLGYGYSLRFTRMMLSHP